MNIKAPLSPSRPHRPRPYDAPPPPYSPLPASTSTSLPGPSSGRMRSSVSRTHAGRATIDDLPLPVLHWIMRLTLDPAATKSTYQTDRAEELVRRRWALFRGLRSVDRRFYIVATSILRTYYLPFWLSCLHPSSRGSSDPFPMSALHFPECPPSTNQLDMPRPAGPVMVDRTRESAVFDHFIAIRVGSELRAVESTLSEEGEAEEDLFRRLQPAARIEDLLLGLPPSLVVPHLPHSGSSGSPPSELPLPHSHLSITLTPLWAQLYLHVQALFPNAQRGAQAEGGTGSGRRGGRDLVLEVKRRQGQALEEVVGAIQAGLENMDRGGLPWGGRI